MRKYIFLFLCVTNLAYGQDQTKEFFSKEGEPTSEATSYYYLIGRKVKFFDLIKRDTFDSYVDTVLTFYSKSNIKRSVTMYNGDGFLNGNYIMYHENGKIKEKGLHFEDKRVGYFISWYANGRPLKTLQYPSKKGEFNSYAPLDFKVINYWDSLGNQLVSNGNGFCKCYLVDEQLREEGKVLSGIRDSVWTGFLKDSLIFLEQYKMGALLKGVRYHENKETKYLEFEHPPEFKGGLEAMYKFLSKNMRYPSEARRFNIQGTVYIGFVVGRNGSIQDAKIIKGIGGGCDEEALRVVKLFYAWIPATIRGKPVNVKFVLPIKFKLD